MKAAKQGDKVRIYFTGKTEDGLEFSSGESEEQAFEVEIGSGMLLPAMDTAIIGMVPGEKKNFSVTKDESIPHREEMIFEVEREVIPPEQEYSLEDILVLGLPTGERLEVTVKKITESHVTLDANPPIAGKDLHIELKLIDIVE